MPEREWKYFNCFIAKMLELNIQPDNFCLAKQCTERTKADNQLWTFTLGIPSTGNSNYSTRKVRDKNENSLHSRWSQTHQKDKHVNSKYLLPQLNLSFSNQFWPRHCTLNTCFTPFHKMEKDWVSPLSGYWECSREFIAVQLWVHWLGLLDTNTNPDFSLQECLELNSVRAPTHQAEKANTSSHVSWSMTLGHANTQNLWQMQLQPQPNVH